MRLATFLDVRQARECVRDLALAAGIRDSGAAELAAAELGNNCVEHGDSVPALLWIACRPGRLSLRFENRCECRPAWRTRKPVAVGGFRTGGYGLPLARSSALSVSCQWLDGRAVVRAEFATPSPSVLGSRALPVVDQDPGAGQRSAMCYNEDRPQDSLDY